MSTSLAGLGPTWRALLAGAAETLGDAIEARRLVEEAAGTDWSHLVLLLDDEAGRRAELLETLVARRRSGEPLQHVLGHWSFRTLELRVDGRALVPRPETEVVVGCALAELARQRAEVGRARASETEEGPPLAGQLLALDLGTGSGAIACALAAEAVDVDVVAVDRSPDALSLAAENRSSALAPSAARRVRLVRADWYSAFGQGASGRVDCVVANPPYLAAHEWRALDPVVREFDPREALVAGPGGLEAVEAVIVGAPGVLAPGGAVVVEIAPHQAEPACTLARRHGAREATIVADLVGRPRVLVARFGGSP